jgi:hypothetical protein
LPPRAGRLVLKCSNALSSFFGHAGQARERLTYLASVSAWRHVATDFGPEREATTSRGRGDLLFAEVTSATSSDGSGGLFPLFSLDALRLGDRLILADRNPPDPATVIDIELKDATIMSVCLQGPAGTWTVAGTDLAALTTLLLDTRCAAVLPSGQANDASAETFRTSLRRPPPDLAPFSVAGAWLDDRLLFIDRHPPEPARIVDILLGDGAARRFVLETPSGMMELTTEQLAARGALALPCHEPPATDGGVRPTALSRRR